MYVLGLVDAPPSLREAIRDGMAARGRAGVITQDGRESTADIEGAWTVSTDDPADENILDVLAPRCAYALLVDAESAWGPSLTVADGLVRGELLAEPTPVDTLDIPHLLDALEETEPYVTLESLVEEVKAHEDEALSGAIATFTGRVRAKEDREDTPTEYLEFEQYGDVAQAELDRIRAELLDREDVFEVRMHHRSGVLHAGEDIVFVVVLAGHRDQAFRTVEDGINRLKATVPIFKKEVTVDEEFWVHNRP